jgi:hypothetical protein
MLMSPLKVLWGLGLAAGYKHQAPNGTPIPS